MLFEDFLEKLFIHKNQQRAQMYVLLYQTADFTALALIAHEFYLKQAWFKIYEHCGLEITTKNTEQITKRLKRLIFLTTS